MRLALSVTGVLVLNASGLAAALPLAGPYGSPWACAVLAANPSSILSDDEPLGWPQYSGIKEAEEIYDDDELGMLVLPNRSVSIESGCNFDTVTEGNDGWWAVTASCGNETQEWTSTFDIRVDGANATIVLDDDDLDDNAFPLKLCDF